MKKSLLFTFLAVLMISVGITSCSSDDDDNFTPSLIGSWQLTEVHFTGDIQNGFPLNDACMMKKVNGYIFNNDTSAKVVQVGFDSEEVLWTWQGNLDSFKLTQGNLAYPPYNFGYQVNQTSYSNVDGVEKLKFTTTLGHGSTAELTLVRKVVSQEELPAVYDKDGNLVTGPCVPTPPNQQ